MVVTTMMVMIVVTMIVVVVAAVVVLTRRVSGMQSNTPIDRGTGMQIPEDRHRMNYDCKTLPDSTTPIQIL